MPKLGIAILTLLLASATAHAQERAEYPEYDVVLGESVQRAVAAKHAQRQMTEAPDDPETLRALLDTGQRDEALQVFRTIVDKRPDAIVAALKSLAARASTLE